LKSLRYSCRLQVHILPPTGMRFRPDRVEVVVGGELPLPLDITTTLGGQPRSFHDCRGLSLNVSFSDPSVVEYIEGRFVTYVHLFRCQTLSALKMGFCLISMSWNMFKVGL